MTNGEAAGLERAVMETSDDAIVATDTANTITSWNRAAERLFGYRADAIVGQPILAIVPADRRDEEIAICRRVVGGEQVRDFATVRLQRGGDPITVVERAAPIRDEHGAVVGILRIARNQLFAHYSNRHLAAIVEWSDDAIVSKDLDGIVTSWNRAAERMFGYSASEMIGQSIRRIIPGNRQGEEDDVLSRIRRGEPVNHFETLRQRKDGVLVPISLTVSPVRDGDGQIVGASKVARDISERMTLTAAAQQQAAISKQLGEIGASLASTLDRDAIVQKVTDAATQLTNAEFGAFFYNNHEQESNNGGALYTSSAAARDAFARLQAVHSAELFVATFRGERVVRLANTEDAMARAPDAAAAEASPDNNHVRSYLAVPVRSASGTVLGGLFFGHSRPGMFTEQHAQLAAGVAAWASVALQNASLYIEARDANRMKDEFLAVLSHELRTPLNAIVGYARLLRAGILTGDKASRGLDTLERNATALTQIVEDVLDISRIVAGKIRLDVQPVELPLVVHNAVATVQPAADAKGVRLDTIVDPRVGPVSGDPDRIQQVVWNLLTNAVRFTPRGGRIQVRLAAVNSHVEIVVSDTGIGIRADFLPHVFERFRQADAGAARMTGGLGLGLAIVRHIVEMHGGTVHAASAGEGRGATFRVELPLMIVHPEPIAERREHPRAGRREPLTSLGDLHGIRVVAVDDEADALTLLKVTLEAAGAEVTTVPSAAAAIERIRAARPHAVVIDLGMPEIDGFELIKRIRSSPDADVRGVPAAALTAFARSEDRTKALRAGFEMHLSKPVDPGELVTSVATLVRRRGGKASGHAPTTPSV